MSQFVKNNKVKINIHFPIRGNISNYCIELNSQIQAICESEIDFSPKSFQIPHLTLYMGFVSSQENYFRMIEEIYLFSKGLKTMEILPTRPYLKGPLNNYVFIDTEQSVEIIDIKRELKFRLSKWIEPLDWDVANETPHITIGYIKRGIREVEKLLEIQSVVPKWIADAIEVSYCGNRGSCLGSIRTFEFVK